MSSSNSSQDHSRRSLSTSLRNATHSAVLSRGDRSRAQDAAPEKQAPKQLRRIAMLLPRLALRGSVRQSLTLADILHERGHSLLIADPGGPLERSSELEGIPRYQWKANPVTGQATWLGRRRLLQRLREFQPDVLHVGALAWPSPWREVSAQLNLPVVATVHSKRNAKLIEPFDFRRLDRLVAISQDAREAVVNAGRVPRENVDLVYPGVRSIPKEALKERFSERVATTPVLACIGPLSDRGSLKTLLTAARLLRDADVDVQLLIIGEGEYEPYVRQYINEYGLGYSVVLVTELFSYEGVFEVADLALISSDANDQAQFALEAMAHGVLPLLSGLGGNFELVTDRKTGLLYNDGDPESLFQVIRETAQSPQLRQELGTQAWEAARVERNALAMATGYEEVYQRALTLMV